jgi:tetratricopeptide (TPR) repeat protein
MFKKELIGILLILLPFVSISQMVGSSKKKIEIQEKKESVSTNIKYDQAVLLAIEANKQLLAGEVKLADSLILLSINTYPTKNVYQYAKTLYQMSNSKTANELMDLVYNQIDKQNTPTLTVPEQIVSNYKDGKPIPATEEKSIDRAKFIFAVESYMINQEFGDFKRKMQILETLSQFKFKKTGGWLTADIEYSQSQDFSWLLYLEKKEYDKAITAIQDIPKSLILGANLRETYIANVYFEKGDYENALKYSNKIGGFLSSTQYFINFKVFALKGENEKSIINFDKYKKYLQRLNKKDEASSEVYFFNEIYYYLAVLDLNKKNYQNALVNLDSALNKRSKIYNNGTLVDRWKIFKLMGDAYTGLQQFEKAKDNYNISLLTNPEYEPTKEAIVKLETIIGTSVSSDKTAPTINLLEPSPKRGLKVTTASANVLIKGIANDISGIKEVSINSKIVYAQKSGDFWGEVPLKEGMNQVTVIATDLVGNRGMQVFEVERLVAKPIVAAVNDVIIPVIEKIGKNYCLLIGAQNYTDANITSLSNPIADAVKLKMILKSTYNFSDENVIQLFNPGTDDVKRQLLELTAQLHPEDNLLIFYAGHGIWVEKEKKGYWLMTDAKRNDPNTWLPNKTVLDLVAKIPSRHTLLITDACFSGSVFKTRGLNDAAPKPIQEMEEKISRIAITSGNDTEVPDESIFMKYLIKALNNNKEKYLTAQKMFINQILEAVMTESKTEPRYGTLELAGHVGGDFIFIKK